MAVARPLKAGVRNFIMFRPMGARPSPTPLRLAKMVAPMEPTKLNAWVMPAMKAGLRVAWARKLSSFPDTRSNQPPTAWAAGPPNRVRNPPKAPVMFDTNLPNSDMIGPTSVVMEAMKDEKPPEDMPRSTEPKKPWRLVAAVFQNGAMIGSIFPAESRNSRMLGFTWVSSGWMKSLAPVMRLPIELPTAMLPDDRPAVEVPDF